MTEIDLSGDGGVLKEILREGEGVEMPCDGSTVIMHYTGTLTDGTKFDSSVDRNEPFEFKLGRGQVIRAFDMGVATMKLKEKCMLTCAANYAYGASGSPPNIPPNATLKFELEMLGWKGEDLSELGDGGIERYVMEKSASKKCPGSGAEVNIHLVGRYNGEIFDERDVEFNLGEGEEYNIIPGVETALEKMSEGEKSKLIIKPKYAFGDNGNTTFKIPIPPNATVEYEVTLIKFVKEVEAWKLDKPESLEQAKLIKENGTYYFKKNKYQMAIKFYEKSLTFLSNCGYNSVSQDDDKNDPIEVEAKSVAISVYLNIALCHQKVDDQDEVRHACDKVLELDPDNVKALYRRGQAMMSLGEADKALEDFQRVNEIEPENKAAINQISICKLKIKAFEDRERLTYRNMFSKFAETDNCVSNDAKI